MIDVETHERLTISTDGDAGPYLMVPSEQLDDVTRVLNENQVPHSIDHDAIELDGRPVIAIVNFGRGADAATIQTLFDAVE
jgi:hypothetical protein